MTRKPRNPKRKVSAAMVALSDFPIVYMSYDEPWADDVWGGLCKVRPDAKRVHGIKGLNACHVEAGEVAGADWFLTVDADTEVDANLNDVRFPKALLSRAFRLDWQSRNAVNGIVSRNGSLKLWPRDLVKGMQSHETAPEDTVSLDADIGAIEPGISRVVLMPGCHSRTDPAHTPFHAFRAGFRETSFLSWLLRRTEAQGGSNIDELRQILTIWCSLGTHRRFGDWLIYGARMGLWAETTWQNWDIRVTHDYDWFLTFWRADILPRIGQGGARCKLSGLAWDADQLTSEIAALGDAIPTVSGLAIANLDPLASRTMAEAQLFPAARALENLDSLGRAFQKGRGVPKNIEMAENLFQDAGAHLHPSGVSNLARLHQLELLPESSTELAETLLEQAMALGCAYAPYHLGTLLKDRDAEVADVERIGRLIDLSAERGFAPKDLAS